MRVRIVNVTILSGTRATSSAMLGTISTPHLSRNVALYCGTRSMLDGMSGLPPG